MQNLKENRQKVKGEKEILCTQRNLKSNFRTETCEMICMIFNTSIWVILKENKQR